MCPACITTLALATAGGTAVGGISALAVPKLTTGRSTRKPSTPNRKEETS